MVHKKKKIRSPQPTTLNSSLHPCIYFECNYVTISSFVCFNCTCLRDSLSSASLAAAVNSRPSVSSFICTDKLHKHIFIVYSDSQRNLLCEILVEEVHNALIIYEDALTIYDQNVSHPQCLGIG